VLLGIWAGSLVDRLGKPKAALLATVANVALLAGLAMGQTILVVYLLAFLIMLARLVLIPARLALVPHVSSKTNLVTANTTLAIVTGVGLFFGPAISAALTLLTGSFQVPLLVAGLGLLLSALPLLSISAPGADTRPDEQVSIWREMRTGWQFIRQHKPVWRVLFCLAHFTLVMGAMMPLITPLSREFGLGTEGTEGTGLFFSAVGFGALIGAPVAALLAKRLNPSVILLLAGLLAPSGALFIGLIDNLEGALVAIMLVHLAGASLNVIVVTVLQRLTPLKIQGYVFGVEQTLMGIAWVVSLATITGGLAILPEEVNTQVLFLLVGGAGFLIILTCWFRYRHQIQTACEMCEPRLQVLGAVCQAVCRSQLPVPGVTCRTICGSQRGCSD
jgi:MFS family permease